MHSYHTQFYLIASQSNPLFSCSHSNYPFTPFLAFPPFFLTLYPLFINLFFYLLTYSHHLRKFLLATLFIPLITMNKSLILSFIIMLILLILSIALKLSICTDLIAFFSPSPTNISLSYSKVVTKMHVAILNTQNFYSLSPLFDLLLFYIA